MPSDLRPGQALAALQAGNRRFVRGEPRHGHQISAARAAAGDQHPIAAVLGCIDSRVPPEAILDQDFGGICAVRSGGQVLDQAVRGSIDFAVTVLRVPLVLVLGHHRCGAVQAAMDSVRTGERPDGPLGFLVDQIAPAVREDGGLADVVRAHTGRTVAALGELPALREPVTAGQVRLAGAVYDLDSGTVELLS